jgi:hypothetical protein
MATELGVLALLIGLCIALACLETSKERHLREREDASRRAAEAEILQGWRP